ncbi:MAG: Trk family potassium uptake protein [Solobacterium sp.]|nr:Trk family potassium uptake protein [Solobacterium sp.]MCH4205693.1 Trk family potassium uptake protein [Solobacterium sp.]MCH4227217.1 Trk family potassium uptake protein [Solobacterium sp.]MCH4282523.1 Trk family potassium uptake protein [Solobacterium sp.]
MQLFSTKKISSTQVIIYGFALLILTGAVLLTLPISTIDGVRTSFLQALFTATSATCVTGLVVQDTATYWSFFGQVVIIVLIQIGGLGIVMVANAIIILSGRKIGLMQRSTLADSISAPHLGGIIKLAKFIFRTTFIIEAIGAFVMSFVFIPQFGWIQGIWYSIFHSISAFCNAGFDLMGVVEPFSSVTSYVGNPIISITIMLLIIVGGLSFMTWHDIAVNHFHFHKYSVQSKMILFATAFLILLPTLYFFFFEFSDMPMLSRVLASFFQAVSPRTAGFNSVDLTKLSDTGKFIQIVLMLIGGAPGSTAGGMKVTTFMVMMVSSFAIFHHSNKAECFNRTISSQTVRNASTVFMMYVTLCIVGGCLLNCFDGIDLLTCFYETSSAIGTVGLTQGITSHLSAASLRVLIILMYTGRVGGLTLIYAVFPHASERKGRYIEENVMIG